MRGYGAAHRRLRAQASERFEELRLIAEACCRQRQHDERMRRQRREQAEKLAAIIAATATYTPEQMAEFIAGLRKSLGGGK